MKIILHENTAWYIRRYSEIFRALGKRRYDSGLFMCTLSKRLRNHIFAYLPRKQNNHRYGMTQDRRWYRYCSSIDWSHQALIEAWHNATIAFKHWIEFAGDNDVMAVRLRRFAHKRSVQQDLLKKSKLIRMADEEKELFRRYNLFD